MCGIAGFVNFDEQRKGREILDRMCRVITHRGPDDQGMMIEGPAALGMRRLSIIDLAGGHEPMVGCHDAITIVFNGEIYNYRELQRELEGRGHNFKTNSDTETIVHAYEEYGRDALSICGACSPSRFGTRTIESFSSRAIALE